MNWQAPSYEEIKMDAEIGSYQEDGETPRDEDGRGPYGEPRGSSSDP